MLKYIITAGLALGLIASTATAAHTSVVSNPGLCTQFQKDNGCKNLFMPNGMTYCQCKVLVPRNPSPCPGDDDCSV